MRWAGSVARARERRIVYRALVGKPEGNRSLGRSKHRWEDNIKMNIQELGGGFYSVLGRIPFSPFGP